SVPEHALASRTERSIDLLIANSSLQKKEVKHVESAAHVACAFATDAPNPIANPSAKAQASIHDYRRFRCMSACTGTAPQESPVHLRSRTLADLIAYNNVSHPSEIEIEMIISCPLARTVVKGIAMKELDGLDNNIEQSQESSEPAHVISREDLGEVHELASKLIEELREVPEGDLVGEILANALKLLRDHTNRGDVKLIDKSFKELRYALKIFSPYRDVRKVSIFGSARTPESNPDYRQAADFAKA